MAFPHQFGAMVHAMLAVPGNPPTYFVAMADPNPGRCSLFSSRDSGDTWKPVSGICQIEIYSLAFFRGDPKVIAAGGRDGVYLTRDSGQTWRRISPAINHDLQPIMSIAIDPSTSDTIYAGTPHLPWRTTNGGQTWASIHTGMIDDSDVFSLEVDATDPRRIFASACSGIYASSDRGSRWSKLFGIPRGSRRTYTIRQDPDNPSTVYAGTSRGLWKSTDRGLHWNQVSDLTVRAIAFDPRDSARFLMATDHSGIVLTTDGAQTTRQANTGFSSRRLRSVVPADGGLLASAMYEAGGNGLYQYSTAEDKWTKLPPQPNSTNLNILSMAMAGRTLLASTYQGMMKSSDTGRTWSVVEGPWRGARVREVSAIAGTVLTATSAGLWRSGDAGANWKRVTEAVNVDSVCVAAGSGDLALAQASSGLLLSKDRGVSWTQVSGLHQTDVYHFAINSDGTILAASSRGLYRSADDARTWQLVDGAPGTGTVRAVAFHPSRPLAFAIHENRLYQTEGGSQTWNLVPGGDLKHVLVHSILIDPLTPDRLYAVTRGRGVMVFPIERN